MHDRPRNDAGSADGEAPIGDLSQGNTESAGAEARERAKDRSKELLGPSWSVNGQVGSRADKLRVVNSVEEESDEIREMIGMVVRKEDVPNPMAVDAGLSKVDERARAEIQQQELVGLDQIARRRALRVDIGSGTEDGESHEVLSSEC